MPPQPPSSRRSRSMRFSTPRKILRLGVQESHNFPGGASSSSVPQELLFCQAQLHVHMHAKDTRSKYGLHVSSSFCRIGGTLYFSSLNLHSCPKKWRKVLFLSHSLDAAPPIPTVDTTRMADRAAGKMRKVSQEAPPRKRIEAEGAGSRSTSEDVVLRTVMTRSFP